MDQSSSVLKNRSPNLPSPRQSLVPVSAKRKRTVFLGAPLPDRIDLGALIDSPPSPPRVPPSLTCPPSFTGPNWRVLHRSPKRLKTGFTQNSYSAATTPSTGGDSIDELSYSLATSPLSHPGGSTQDRSECSDEADTSFFPTQDPPSSFPNTSEDPERPPIPPLATLTDLKDLPRPKAIEAAPSNSFSITALVAVLSVAEPRTVSTRFGSKTQVVTLTVGDPTRAPFRIDAWLEIRPKSVDAMELKAVVRELRIQDVIVVKNLRLGVWNNAVFGTTWRVGSRGGSALWLVHRLRWEGSDERRRWRRRWDEAVLAERKVANMIKWVKALVGSGPGLGMNGRVLREEEEQLPEDTQPRNSSLF